MSYLVSNSWILVLVTQTSTSFAISTAAAALYVFSTQRIGVQGTDEQEMRTHKQQQSGVKVSMDKKVSAGSPYVVLDLVWFVCNGKYTQRIGLRNEQIYSFFLKIAFLLDFQALLNFSPIRVTSRQKRVHVKFKNIIIRKNWDLTRWLNIRKFLTLQKGSFACISFDPINFRPRTLFCSPLSYRALSLGISSCSTATMSFKEITRHTSEQNTQSQFSPGTQPKQASNSECVNNELQCKGEKKTWFVPLLAQKSKNTTHYWESINIPGRVKNKG